MELKSSETVKNLMRAFAGESQARNRYTFAAEKACEQKLHLLYEVFTLTANQEKEHAEIFMEHLSSLTGQTIEIDGGFPVEVSDSLTQHLEWATHNEYAEHDTVYKSFAETAREEGFPQIAASFENIAKIEKIHGDRFKHFSELMSKGELFDNKSEGAWFCLNCGHVHAGPQAPNICPVCKHAQGFFVRAEMTPYTQQPPASSYGV